MFKEKVYKTRSQGKKRPPTTRIAKDDPSSRQVRMQQPDIPKHDAMPKSNFQLHIEKIQLSHNRESMRLTGDEFDFANNASDWAQLAGILEETPNTKSIDDLAKLMQTSTRKDKQEKLFKQQEKIQRLKIEEERKAQRDQEERKARKQAKKEELKKRKMLQKSAKTLQKQHSTNSIQKPFSTVFSVNSKRGSMKKTDSTTKIDSPKSKTTVRKATPTALPSGHNRVPSNLQLFDTTSQATVQTVSWSGYQQLSSFIHYSDSGGQTQRTFGSSNSSNNLQATPPPPIPALPIRTSRLAPLNPITKVISHDYPAESPRHRSPPPSARRILPPVRLKDPLELNLMDQMSGGDGLSKAMDSLVSPRNRFKSPTASPPTASPPTASPPTASPRPLEKGQPQPKSSPKSVKSFTASTKVNLKGRSHAWVLGNKGRTRTNENAAISSPRGRVDSYSDTEELPVTKEESLSISSPAASKTTMSSSNLEVYSTSKQLIEETIVEKHNIVKCLPPFVVSCNGIEFIPCDVIQTARIISVENESHRINAKNETEKQITDEQLVVTKENLGPPSEKSEIYLNCSLVSDLDEKTSENEAPLPLDEKIHKESPRRELVENGHTVKDSSPKSLLLLESSLQDLKTRGTDVDDNDSPDEDGNGKLDVVNETDNNNNNNPKKISTEALDSDENSNHKILEVNTSSEEESETSEDSCSNSEDEKDSLVTDLADMAADINIDGYDDDDDSEYSSEEDSLEADQDEEEINFEVDWTIKPGELVDIKGRLGKGATATVWRGVIHDQPVAVKQIDLRTFSEGLKHAQRVTQREYEIVRLINHKSIIRYYGLFYNKAEQQVNLVMELVVGVPITDLVLYKTVLTEEQAGYILFYVVQAIEYLHRNFVIHRDLKPDNVLISLSGVVKLIDFGTATPVKPSEESKRRSTVGTPWYCAPEVINNEEYGYRCDIWSIGCFAIELVSGKPPFDELNDIACLQKMAEGSTPPLPEDISDICNDFLSKCLLSNWRERPTSTELLKHPFLLLKPEQEASVNKELISIVKEMREEKTKVKHLGMRANCRIQTAKHSLLNIKL